MPNRRTLLRVAALASLVVVGGLVAVVAPPDRVAKVAPNVSPIRANVDLAAPLGVQSGGITDLEARFKAKPNDVKLQVQLGLAYVQRARETSDPTFYDQADGLLVRARAADPANIDAILGAATLALSRHRFAAALRLGQQALELSGGASAAALGVVGDAQVELGQYELAFATFERMGATRPGLVSYARQSYASELTGDLDIALELMHAAVQAGSGAPENTAWTRIQLGNLLLADGRVDEAEEQFKTALHLLPGYARAEAGLGAVAVARGDLTAAQKHYETASLQLPLAEIAVALGDVRAAQGDTSGATSAYGLARLELQTFTQAGGDADLELAAFAASHEGILPPAEVVALARRALADRPSVFAEDTLAWALYRSGACREALRHARRATRLGTVNPTLWYHLGAIAGCAGRPDIAIPALHAAVDRTPSFHPIDAPEARELLNRLEA